jgi:MoxR-like ATPase
LADRDWWAEGMATPAAFVGREDELSRLLAALANQTRMVLVVGDAGVGKTELAREAMARVAVTGMVTVRRPATTTSGCRLRSSGGGSNRPSA